MLYISSAHTYYTEWQSAKDCGEVEFKKNCVRRLKLYPLYGFTSARTIQRLF